MGDQNVMSVQDAAQACNVYQDTKAKFDGNQLWEIVNEVDFSNLGMTKKMLKKEQCFRMIVHFSNRAIAERLGQETDQSVELDLDLCVGSWDQLTYFVDLTGSEQYDVIAVKLSSTGSCAGLIDGTSLYHINNLVYYMVARLNQINPS